MTTNDEFPSNVTSFEAFREDKEARERGFDGVTDSIVAAIALSTWSHPSYNRDHLINAIHNQEIADVALSKHLKKVVDDTGTDQHLLDTDPLVMAFKHSIRVTSELPKQQDAVYTVEKIYATSRLEVDMQSTIDDTVAILYKIIHAQD